MIIMIKTNKAVMMDGQNDEVLFAGKKKQETFQFQNVLSGVGRLSLQTSLKREKMEWRRWW